MLWPLPHPLLLQLHALCGRVKRLRAAAGWPVLPYGDGSDDEVSWGEGEEVEIWDEDEEGVEARCDSEYDGVVGILACGAGAEPETEPESGMGGGQRQKTEV
ncbi:hypothetical protein DFP73DRAFT_599166 [Morchella snyderi]|nr:hypothetical protein DFP73DRAFT_599166 [Morchella snyderi]